MKKISLITINTFSIIPVCRYVIEALSIESKLLISECFIENAYNFKEQGRVNYIAKFRDRNHFLNQTKYIKLKKYFNLVVSLTRILVDKNVKILYTPDIHVLSLFFILNKWAARKDIKIIYHQFELIDPSLCTNSEIFFWKIVNRNINKIDSCFFPEINRLIFFCKKTGYQELKCSVFLNSCRIGKTSITPPEALKNISKNDLIIGHVGNVGPDHYLNEFIKIANELSTEKNIHFVAIGNLSKKVEYLLAKIMNPNFYLIGEVPHKDLYHYYSYIDIGLILYKGVDLNYEYCAPNKMYEYWSYGIYVIAHPLKGLLPFFKRDKLGVLSDMADISSIKDKLKILLERKYPSKDDVKEEFNKKYSIDEQLTRFKNIINEFT